MFRREKLHFVLIVGALLLLIVPAYAQFRPDITVSPRWERTDVLTSLRVSPANPFPYYDNNGNYEPFTGNPPGGDDEVNYISVDFSVTTNVEFWTAELNCRVPANMLEFYNQNATSDDHRDNVRGSFHPNEHVWEQDYVLIDRVSLQGDNLHVIMSQTAPARSIGQNGVDNTYVLGWIEIRIKPQVAAVFNGNATFTCTTNFLDRNGQRVATARYVAPPPLRIRSGFTIRGSAEYQGLRSHAGIGVRCESENGYQPPAVRTLASGLFTIGGIREFGNYHCVYFGNTVTIEPASVPPIQQDDAYLPHSKHFFLEHNSHEITLQTVVLRAGNVDRIQGSTGGVDIFDVNAVTAQYGSAVPLAYALGDANGDRRIDQADLALVTSNFGLDGVLYHESYILSGQLMPGNIFPNSRIHLSTTPTWFEPVEWRQLVTGNNQDLWAVQSPDGSQIAFTRAVGTGANLRYAIFVMNSNGTGAARRVTPVQTTYDFFAPSWSPDSTRLAFVATSIWENNNRAYRFNQGNLGIVEASGRSFQIINQMTRIYPPTWWYNYSLVFGSMHWDTLMQYNIWNNTTHYFHDEFLNGASNSGTEDMPVIKYGRVYYRYFDGTNYSLRMATLNYDEISGMNIVVPLQSAPLPPGGCCSEPPTDYHVTIYDDQQVLYHANNADSGLIKTGFISGDFMYMNGWVGYNAQSGYYDNNEGPIYHWFYKQVTLMNSDPSIYNGMNGYSDFWALQSTVQILP